MKRSLTSFRHVVFRGFMFKFSHASHQLIVCLINSTSWGCRCLGTNRGEWVAWELSHFNLEGIVQVRPVSNTSVNRSGHVELVKQTQLIVCLINSTEDVWKTSWGGRRQDANRGEWIARELSHFNLEGMVHGRPALNIGVKQIPASWVSETNTSEQVKQWAEKWVVKYPSYQAWQKSKHW